MAEFTHFGHTSIKTELIRYYRREGNVIRVFLKGEKTPVDVVLKNESVAITVIRTIASLDVYGHARGSFEH